MGKKKGFLESKKMVWALIIVYGIINILTFSAIYLTMKYRI